MITLHKRFEIYTAFKFWPSHLNMHVVTEHFWFAFTTINFYCIYYFRTTYFGPFLWSCIFNQSQNISCSHLKIYCCFCSCFVLRKNNLYKTCCTQRYLWTKRTLFFQAKKKYKRRVWYLYEDLHVYRNIVSVFGLDIWASQNVLFIYTLKYLYTSNFLSGWYPFILSFFPFWLYQYC